MPSSLTFSAVYAIISCKVACMFDNGRSHGEGSRASRSVARPQAFAVGRAKSQCVAGAERTATLSSDFLQSFEMLSRMFFASFAKVSFVTSDGMGQQL
jgi:hypothetical protein